jgi:CheY-like chemotaxis protein
MRALIADDDRVVSLLMTSILQKDGWQVTPAFDAMQALMFSMRNPPPDLIVLDINMPGGTGADTLKKLKLSAKTAMVPVLVVSGSTEPDIRDRVQALGAAEFLAKPVEADLFMAAVKRVTADPGKAT